MSASKQQHEAAKQYVAGLQRSLSCITNSVLIKSRERDSNLFALMIAGQPVRLSDTDITLVISERFQLVEHPKGWVASRSEYSYRIIKSDKEAIAFHWHPQGRSSYKKPHVHTSLIDLDLSRKAHLPTNKISMGDVIEFLICEIGVKPLRQDWQQAIQ